MTSQVEGNEKGDELQKKFDDYKHPETNRLMSQVSSLKKNEIKSFSFVLEDITTLLRLSLNITKKKVRYKFLLL